MVGAFFWGIFAVFSPYCPSAGFYNLWGQPTSNFKRLCDFERDGERERGREGWMDGWMVFGCLRGEGGLRRILLGGATVNSATIDGMRDLRHKWFLVERTDVSRSELDVVGTSC
ncbi:Hypothetical predicted protein [Prunus dulcis]|uniref:Secreted protein n=1 Tax=Prunus dulcis TaxID=3755 RepID=A0A5E4E3R3_PRUDU|nr:Hypothetical predicted protein [Prunus dulcis]